MAAEVSGKVAQTLVNEGDFVNAGAVIVRLDAEDAALRLRQARDAEAQESARSRELWSLMLAMRS